MATTTKTEIQSSAIYKVQIKGQSSPCWAVPSDSQTGTMYTVCWDSQSTRWTCTCLAGSHGYGDCKHRRAVQDSIKVNTANPANTELEAEVKRAETFLSLKALFDIRSSAQQAA